MQELVSLREHILMIIKTGTAQTHAAATALNWERLRGAVATMTDKAMYLLVAARTPLCERGGRSAFSSQLMHSCCHPHCALQCRTNTSQNACASHRHVTRPCGLPHKSREYTTSAKLRVYLAFPGTLQAAFLLATVVVHPHLLTAVHFLCRFEPGGRELTGAVEGNDAQYGQLGHCIAAVVSAGNFCVVLCSCTCKCHMGLLAEAMHCNAA